METQRKNNRTVLCTGLRCHTGRPAYPGLLLFKMLLVSLWHGGLSDKSVEDIANANLNVMRFLGLDLEDTEARWISIWL
ncbi:MAG: transposase [Nitrosomonas sp.]